MAKVIRWSMAKMIAMIVRILNNKFDCFIVIEGNRGLGKSTLAIHLARGVAREFKKMGSTDYKFNWKHSLVYTKKETKHFWHKWRAMGIGDEMINVTFNRDFYNEDQKDIIKLMNMNRDHANCFIACVPRFQTLDSQIKDLCKIRITVVRRGLCVIQTPQQSIYIKDKWDQSTNEKIEREWMRKGVTRPHYTRLTTFRGIMKYPKLRDKAEEKYQAVKDLKRNLVAKDQMGIDDEENKQQDPFELMYQLLTEGKIRNNTYFDGMAVGHGLNPASVQARIRTKLKKEGKDHSIPNYYWEEKKKKAKQQAGAMVID